MKTSYMEQSVDFKIACAWCGTIIGSSQVEGSYGVCIKCRPRVILSSELTSEQVADIPLGLLQLDADGRVLNHEDPLHRSMTRRNLFTNVVPFTLVRGFREQFRDFLARGDAGRIFNLPFRSEQGEVYVRVFFGRVCGDIVLVRIKAELAG